jgi:hypothetical protein
VTTSQVRSGIQRDTARASETQRVTGGHSGTQKFLERNFRLRVRSAPPASSGRRRQAPRTESLSKFGSEFSRSSRRRPSSTAVQPPSCEQFLYLIKERVFREAPGWPIARRDADSGTRFACLFVSCCVLRGVGAPPTAFRPARMQPDRSWRWRVAIQACSGSSVTEGPVRKPAAQPLHTRLHGKSPIAIRDTRRKVRVATA